MRAEIIADGDRLEALAPAWDDLFGRVPSATPFSASAWLLPWWRSFAPGALRGVAVWDGEQLVGLAPLYREDGPHGRRLLPLGIGVSDHTDILLDPGCAAAAGAAIVAALDAIRAEWEVWSAEELAPDAAMLGLAVPASWRRDVSTQSACPVLGGVPDSAPVDRVPAGMARKWRMAQNRAARRDAVFEEAAPGLLDDLFRLHGARWESRGEAGVLADARVRAFHAAAVPRLQAAGLLRLLALRIDGAVAGVYYGLQRGARQFAYLQGFDPAFGFESPGTLLVGHAIAGLNTGGTMSFLRGQEPYKYRWGAVDRWNSRCLLGPAR